MCFFFFQCINIFKLAKAKSLYSQTILFPMVSLFLTSPGFLLPCNMQCEKPQSDYSTILNQWTMGFLTGMLSAPFNIWHRFVVAILFITNAFAIVNTFSSRNNEMVGMCSVLWIIKNGHTKCRVSSVGMPFGLTSYPFYVSAATLQLQREGRNTFET